MNDTGHIVLVRQVIVRTIYLIPFVIGFWFIESPFNILCTCLLVLKSKLPSDTDLFELQALAKHTATIATRGSTESDKENLRKMQQAFVFDDETLHQADMDGSMAKFLVDSAFDIFEALIIAVMIIWYATQVF